MTLRPEVNDLVKLAKRHGWDVSSTRSHHLCFRHPSSGEKTYGPSTPSDWRSLRNLKAQLRRAGLEVPR